MTTYIHDIEQLRQRSNILEEQTKVYYQGRAGSNEEVISNILSQLDFLNSSINKIAKILGTSNDKKIPNLVNLQQSQKSLNTYKEEYAKNTQQNKNTITSRQLDIIVLIQYDINDIKGKLQTILNGAKNNSFVPLIKAFMQYADKCWNMLSASNSVFNARVLLSVSQNISESTSQIVESLSKESSPKNSP